jgi:hypothetical protein
MPASTIDTYASRMDAVWASVEPGAWTRAHPGMIVSDYFIMGLDQYSLTHQSLSWWQQNHPDWVLYACTASGAPTHDVAYMSGIGVPDVPLDIHNSSVVSYQIGTMSRAARSAGYTALAVDQVVFWNIYLGGNPNFGQSVKSGEYGCGVWEGGTFVRRYASSTDPQYAADVVQYVRQARAIAHSYGLTLVTNHPAGNVAAANEQQLLQSTDIDMDETGFSAYGHYTQYNGAVFRNELAYLQYAQAHGTGMLVIDKFTNESSVTASSLEYSIATYLMANDGGLLLFVGGLSGYGTMQYHSEYSAPIARACSMPTGGPYVYSRRFSGGLAVVNASGSAQMFTLPAGTYRDLEGRAVRNPLPLVPNDAYVLLGGSGCS